MAFDFSTLVTDRKQNDVAYVKQLIAKIVAGTETEAELAEWKSFTLKGSYNYTDLNRVTAAMEDLKLRLEGYGYAVPGYQKIEIEHPSVSEKLPYGYIELDYIESTGTQYCSIPPVNTTGDFELAFDVTPVQYATWSCLLTNIGKGGIWVGKVNTGTFSLRTYSGSNHINATLPELNKRLSVNVKCVTGTSSFYLNGVSQGTASVAYTETASCALLSDGAGSGFIGRLYSCQIYESGVLVRNFVPCVNSSNEAGLYDMVNGVFYKNAGTGTFTTGNVITIPSPSQPIDIDPYTWYEFDWPTPEAMTMYLLNVAAIRTVLSVLQSTPRVPLDMEKLMVQEANDIEQIVLDVYRQITIMPTTFIPCGEALCGGDNL